MRALLLIGVVAVAVVGLWLAFGGTQVDGPTGTLPGDADSPDPTAPEGGPSLAGRDHDVPTALDQDDVTQRAGPPVSLSGVVTGSGTLLRDARVEVRALLPAQVQGLQAGQVQYGAPSVRYGTRGALLAEATTGADGAFRLSLARRTRYGVRIEAAGFAVYLGHVQVPLRAELEPIRVQLAPGFEFVGVVVDAEGTPAPRFDAQLFTRPAGDASAVPSDSAVVARNTSGADGRFSLGHHQPGSYVVVVSRRGGARIRKDITVPTAGVVRVVVPRSATATGTLRERSGRAVPGARVSILAYARGLDTLARGSATTQPDGSFRVTGISGEVMDVAVHPPGGIWVSSRAETLEHDLTTLTPGTHVTQDLFLPRTRSLAGRVSGTDSVAGTQVALVSRKWQVQVGHTSVAADGGFRFDGIPEQSGTYVLAAVRPDDSFLAAYHPHDAWAGGGGFSDFGAANPIVLELREFGRVEGHIEQPPAGSGGVLLAIGDVRAQVSVDDSGGFVFPHVPPSRDVKARFWSRAPYESDQWSEPFEVVAGEVTRPVISFAPPPRVRGVVRGQDGEPVVGAFVSMARDPRLDYGSGWLHVDPASSPWVGVRTDAEGAFDVDWMPPTRYSAPEPEAWSLSVSHPAHAGVTLRDLGVPTRSEPLTVEITLVPGVSARGRVLAPDGAPAVGARVEVVQGHLLIATTDAQGWFEVGGLAAGGYAVRATLGEARSPLDADKHHRVESTDTEPTLVLVPVPVLAGLIVDDSGAPVPLANVQALVPKDDKEEPDALENVPPEMRERMRARLGRYGRTVVAQIEADERGRFRLECAEAGAYELVIEPGWRTRAGFLHTVTKPLETGQSELVIKLRMGARVSGRVVDLDGRPVAGADVIGAWAEPKGWGMGMSHDNFRPMVHTDADGRFVLTGLDEGRVGLVVAAAGFLPLHERDVPVNTEVKLVIERGDEIEGRVLTPAGEPFVGLSLKLVERQPDGAPKDPSDWLEERRTSMEAMVGSAVLHSHLNHRLETRTDGAGHFLFAGLAPGRYEILLERAMVGADDPLFPATIVQSDSPPLIIETQAALTVSGIVVDEAGKPVHYWWDGRQSRPHVGCHQKAGKKTWSGETAWDFTETDGTFHIGGLSPGPVRIHVTAGDDYGVVDFDTAAGAEDIRIVLHKLTDEEKAARDRAEKDAFAKRLLEARGIELPDK